MLRFLTTVAVGRGWQRKEDRMKGSWCGHWNGLGMNSLFLAGMLLGSLDVLICKMATTLPLEDLLLPASVCVLSKVPQPFSFVSVLQAHV